LLGLSATDQELLGRIPFPVVLPSTLPSGWTGPELRFFEDPDDEADKSLEAVFQGPDSANWSVSTAVGGLGDPIPGEENLRAVALTHSDFGSITVHCYTEDGSPELLSEWFPGEEGAELYHGFRGSNVTDADLKALVDSLRLYD
jgi:hypothetical protein